MTDRHISENEMTEIATLELIAKNEALMVANLVVANPELNSQIIISRTFR